MPKKSKFDRKKLEKIFYIITIISVLVFAMGLLMSTFTSYNITELDVIDFMVIIPFCTWAWLIIFGLVLFHKDWKICLICGILFLPHLLLLIVDYQYSYSIMDVLKQYLLIFTFGIPRLF